MEINLDAPKTKVTREDIEHNIIECYYLNLGSAIEKEYNVPVGGPASTTTLCVVLLKNGYTVTGESACADPANYDRELGEKYALEDAIKKIWPLMGYELKTKLSQ